MLEDSDYHDKKGREGTRWKGRILTYLEFLLIKKKTEANMVKSAQRIHRGQLITFCMFAIFHNVKKN